MDTVTAIILVLFVLAVFLLGSSITARRHSETQLTLRRMEAKVGQLMDRTGLQPQDDLAEVHRAVVAGQKIRAVKAYREATGADLVTAKRTVERIQRGESLD